MSRYHPWRELRKLEDWTLEHAVLADGHRADICWPSRTITLSRDLTQAERRSSLTHELIHVERGPYPGFLAAREEAEVCNEAAFRLIDIDDLGEALVWSDHPPTVAELLWVDVPTLLCRLRMIHHGAERGYIGRRLADGGRTYDLNGFVGRAALASGQRPEHGPAHDLRHDGHVGDGIHRRA